MEKISNISWILVGKKSSSENELDKETTDKMALEAFMEGKVYTLFLCGEIVPEKTGTLIEMEEGFTLLKNNFANYKDGDYCIISSHQEGELLFMPTDENLDEISK